MAVLETRKIIMYQCHDICAKRGIQEVVMHIFRTGGF